MTDVALIGRLVAATCTIACLLAGLRFALRGALRAGAGGTHARTIAVLETVRLPEAATLHLIRAGDRLLVIGRSGAHLAVICDVPPNARGSGPLVPEA